MCIINNKIIADHLRKFTQYIQGYKTYGFVPSHGVFPYHAYVDGPLDLTTSEIHSNFIREKTYRDREETIKGIYLFRKPNRLVSPYLTERALPKGHNTSRAVRVWVHPTDILAADPDVIVARKILLDEADYEIMVNTYHPDCDIVDY